MRTKWASLALPVTIAGVLLASPSLAAGQSSGRAGSLIRDGQKALQAQDYQAAARLFGAAAAADPGSPEASCGLGQARLALRQYPEAVRALESCRTQILANLRKLQSEQSRAFGSIQDEIRELRDTIRAIRTGRIKTGADRIHMLERRVRELEQMQSRDPVRVEVPQAVSFALATAYREVGRFDDAERELLTVLRSDPELGEAHRQLASVYLAQGRFAEAAERVSLAEAAGVQVSPQVKVDIAAQRAPAGVAPVPPSARPSRAEEEPISIRHTGRTCAANGAFIHLTVSVVPSWGVHDPIVRFRSEEDGGWYSAIMLPAGADDFATTLPKPRGAKGFEYYIEVSSYDETTTRTDGFQVAVVKKRVECAEAAEDPDQVASVLIIDPPRDVSDPPPVPSGFSIRGTTADVGMLEIGKNKALLAGGVALAGAAAVAIAAASQPPGDYEGPHPFEDGPGVEFVTSDPPPGSTLSLSSGHIAIQLNLFSPQPMPGARIRAELALSQNGGPCIVVQTHHDLPGGRTESVVVSGPILRNELCNIRFPLEVLRVAVVEADGIGGFRTGIPPLRHLNVQYFLEE